MLLRDVKLVYYCFELRNVGVASAVGSLILSARVAIAGTVNAFADTCDKIIRCPRVVRMGKCSGFPSMLILFALVKSMIIFGC